MKFSTIIVSSIASSTTTSNAFVVTPSIATSKPITFQKNAAVVSQQMSTTSDETTTTTQTTQRVSISEELGLPCEDECAIDKYPNLPDSVHPGVLSGQAMVDLLDHAKENESLVKLQRNSTHITSKF